MRSSVYILRVIQEWKAAGCEVFIGSGYGPDYGTLLRQAKALGYNPKAVFALKGAINYIEAAGAWGEDLADSVCCELYWDTSIKNAVGIGGTTPQDLVNRWGALHPTEPVNKAIGWDYSGAQILIDAIERAGTLDREAVQKAIGETWGLQTMYSTIWMDKETHRHDGECQIGQWQKTATGWQQVVVFSYNANMPAASEIKLRK
jgi:branched-chain amino acid transport system substrate-binding protein